MRVHRMWSARPDVIALYDDALPAGVARSRGVDLAVERAYKAPERLARALQARVERDPGDQQPVKRYAFTIAENTAARLDLLAEQLDLPIELVVRLAMEAHLAEMLERNGNRAKALDELIGQ